MMDDAAMIEALERALEFFRARAPGSSPSAPGIPNDLIDVGEAAQIARHSKSVVRKWCAKNPISSGGYAVRIEGKWYVSRSLFRRAIFKHAVA